MVLFFILVYFYISQGAKSVKCEIELTKCVYFIEKRYKSIIKNVKLKVLSALLPIKDFRNPYSLLSDTVTKLFNREERFVTILI